MQKFSYVGKYNDSGSTNSFYKVRGRRYGFKSFPNKSLAEFAHKAQSILSLEVLAPKVYSPVCKIRVPNYFICKGGKTKTNMVLSDWGYLTEIAKPYNCNSQDCDGDCANDSCCDNYDIIQDLLNNIEGCGLSYADAHPGNFGYIKRGKNQILVAIDLGAESVTTEDDHYPPVCWDGVEDADCYCDQCRNNYKNYNSIQEYDYA